MQIIVMLLTFLFFTGVSAQTVVERSSVRIDLSKGLVEGLPSSEVIEYSGMTAKGICFIITRPNVPVSDWDSRIFTGLYDGKCDEALQSWGEQKPRKSRDGRITFEYNMHATPEGPFKEDFDVILISALPSVASVYKKERITLLNLKKASIP